MKSNAIQCETKYISTMQRKPLIGEFVIKKKREIKIQNGKEDAS